MRFSFIPESRQPGVILDEHYGVTNSRNKGHALNSRPTFPDVEKGMCLGEQTDVDIAMIKRGNFQELCRRSRIFALIASRTCRNCVVATLHVS